MVKWIANLTDNYVYEGAVDDGSWHEFRDKILPTHEGRRIIGMSLLGDQAGASIDPNCDGYFIGNKMITAMPQSIQMHFVGIGYWKKHDTDVRIKWYNANTMELAFTEARPVENCGFFLVRNP